MWLMVLFLETSAVFSVHRCEQCSVVTEVSRNGCVLCDSISMVKETGEPKRISEIDKFLQPLTVVRLYHYLCWAQYV
jgi:hypothetical protein